jgi:hypothetical protein
MPSKRKISRKTDSNKAKENAGNAAQRVIGVNEIVQTQQDCEAAKAHDGSGKNKSKDKHMTTYERWSLIVTIIGVAVGVLVLVIYALQLREMRKATEAANQAANAAQKSTDAAMAGQRAYVATTAYWTLDDAATHARFGVIMRNVGNLPTRKLRNYIDFVITADDLPDNFSFPLDAPPLSTGTFLVPKDQVFSPHIPKDGDGIAQSELEAIRKGQKNLYFFGWIKYFDGFALTPERITEFCYRLRVTGDKKQPFGFIPYRKYNCADEGCEKYSPQKPN